MKNTYRYCVVETIKKWVEIEAENRDEAEELALNTDMDKNPDFYEREAILASETIEDEVTPVHVGNWNRYDPETMTYWKQDGNVYTAICLLWYDAGINEEGRPLTDTFVIIEGTGDDLESALENLDIMPFCISDVMTKANATKTMMEYMKGNL